MQDGSGSFQPTGEEPGIALSVEVEPGVLELKRQSTDADCSADVATRTNGLAKTVY